MLHPLPLHSWPCYIHGCVLSHVYGHVISKVVLYEQLFYIQGYGILIACTVSMWQRQCCRKTAGCMYIGFFGVFFFVKHNHTNATFCISKDGIMEYADYTGWYRNCSTKCEKQFRSALCMIPKVILTTQGVPAPITAGYEKASWNVHIVISSKKQWLNGNATETFTGWNFGRKSN